MEYRKTTKCQHRITANSGYSAEKCYFRDQVKNNKADKNVSVPTPLALYKTVVVHYSACSENLIKFYSFKKIM
ncbi:hypothetical protein JM83_2984 [Gillisia sp. Hel_I_86]|nr:hypothetical protein JM83_2984 [Gillisia sp. Hel_I_86]